MLVKTTAMIRLCLDEKVGALKGERRWSEPWWPLRYSQQAGCSKKRDCLARSMPTTPRNDRAALPPVESPPSGGQKPAVHQRTSRRQSRSTALRLIPPLWALLLVTSYVLTLIGFKLLPPDESKLTQPSWPPVLNIWVDRPGVHLMAVLNGELALDGSPLR
jgi:hypothetical protein